MALSYYPVARECLLAVVDAWPLEQGWKKMEKSVVFFVRNAFEEIWMYIIDGKMLECAKRIESLNAKLLDH